MTSSSIPVVHVGLGPLGIRLLRLMAERPVFSLTGAVDVNPALVGKDVADLSGNEVFRGTTVTDALPPIAQPGRAVAILTTVSTVAQIQPQIEACLNAGYHMVTTCEELTFPWHIHPERSACIDKLAREKGLSILAAGVNPGFMMDFLPQALTAISHRVDKIAIERFQDATPRRLPFRQKVGVGLSQEAFKKRVADGSLRHVGLEESMYLIAAQFGWKLERTEEFIEPVIAQQDYCQGDVSVHQGDVSGVMQTGRAYRGDEEVLTLLFKAAVGLENPHDKIVIAGDPSFESVIAGGIGGDVATCSIVLNACRAIIVARPGLRTMTEVPGISWYEAWNQQQ